MIEVKIIDSEHKKDINIPNEPFELFGRVVVSRADGEWTWELIRFAPENVAENKPEERNDQPRHEFSPEDLRARIDEAAELWRTRVELARAQTIDKLGLDAAGTELFNAAVDNMNVKLRDSIQTIATRLANEENMTPELGVRLMGDLCTTLAESYDEIGQCVGEDRRGEISTLELHNFVDPSVAEPLIQVQGKLGGLGMGPGGPR